MKEYAYCPKCNAKYSVSKLRDKSKAFICADCVGRDREKMTHKRYRPIYNGGGFATVIVRREL